MDARIRRRRHDRSLPGGSPVSLLVMRDVVVSLRRFSLGPVSLELAPGDTLAVVGPNGCGKSTLLTAALGLRRIASGLVTIAAHRVDLTHPPRRTGAFLQVGGVLPWCNAPTNLRLLHEPEVVSDDDIAAVLQRVGLDHHRAKPVSTYSTGMHTRLGLARALLAQPALLVLDEPTVGLDSDGVSWLVEELQAQAESGVGVLVASHDRELLAGLGCPRFPLARGLPASSAPPASD